VTVSAGLLAATSSFQRLPEMWRSLEARRLSLILGNAIRMSEGPEGCMEHLTPQTPHTVVICEHTPLGVLYALAVQLVLRWSASRKYFRLGFTPGARGGKHGNSANRLYFTAPCRVRRSSTSRAQTTKSRQNRLRPGGGGSGGSSTMINVKFTLFHWTVIMCAYPRKKSK
jgi:hypothetical protein